MLSANGSSRPATTHQGKMPYRIMAANGGLVDRNARRSHRIGRAVDLTATAQIGLMTPPRRCSRVRAHGLEDRAGSSSCTSRWCARGRRCRRRRCRLQHDFRNHRGRVCGLVRPPTRPAWSPDRGSMAGECGSRVRSRSRDSGRTSASRFRRRAHSLGTKAAARERQRCAMRVGAAPSTTPPTRSRSRPRREGGPTIDAGNRAAGTRRNHGSTSKRPPGCARTPRVRCSRAVPDRCPNAR